MPKLRRWVVFCLVLLLIATAASAEPYEHPYPEALQISVETEVWQSETHGDVSVDLPHTAVESVNRALREAADALLKQTAAYPDSRADMTATYRVSGTKWAGFLLTGRAVAESRSQSDTFTTENTLALFYQVLTSDMETGRALTLSDVFDENSSAWPTLTEAAREMLYSYYPDETRDEDALERLIAPEALRGASFLPCAGRLLVPFSLERILPDHQQIAWLILPYPDYRPLMRPQAMLQTDNSTRPMIALTFDDGPTRTYTQKVLSGLARYGAGATFFCVGKAVIKQPDMLRREMDFGHTVAAHSMTHENPWEQSAADMLAEYGAQKQLYQDVSGLPVTLLRPPGGDLKTYVTRQVGWPLIRWHKSGSDTGPDYARDVARRVVSAAAHGDIFLMHDTKEKTADAVPLILEALKERGFMFATVDELLYLNGVTPQPNVAYYDGLGVKTYPSQ
ncbi:MAG: polysaccharide deacetylase family protein [Bacillota bacterium]